MIPWQPERPARPRLALAHGRNFGVRVFRAALSRRTCSSLSARRRRSNSSRSGWNWDNRAEDSLFESASRRRPAKKIEPRRGAGQSDARFFLNFFCPKNLGRKHVQETVNRRSTKAPLTHRWTSHLGGYRPYSRRLGNDRSPGPSRHSIGEREEGFAARSASPGSASARISARAQTRDQSGYSWLDTQTLRHFAAAKWRWFLRREAVPASVR